MKVSLITWLVVVALFNACVRKEAMSGRFQLDYSKNVAIGSTSKVSLVAPFDQDLPGLEFTWEARDGGKFESASTKELFNYYVAPSEAVTGTIVVTIKQQGTTVDAVSGPIIVVGQGPATSSATPSAQESEKPLASPRDSSGTPSTNVVEIDSMYYPAGWMGDGQAGRKYVQVDDNWRDNPHSAPSCFKWSYNPGEKGWAAVGWQYPEQNFGQTPGRNLAGFSKVTVWLRGERGDEKLILKAGGHTSPNARHPASFEALPVSVTLSREWQRFEISLTNFSLSNVPCIFVWVATRQENTTGPIVFYLDDLRIEK